MFKISSMEYKLLQNRTVYDILIGDMPVYKDYSMPRYSGPQLCELSTTFGLQKSYVWGGQNASRWEYMRDLMAHVEENNRTNDLLSYLFAFQRFESHTLSGTQEEIKQTYNEIVNGAIAKINEKLIYGGAQLQIIKNQFVLSKIGETPIVEAPKVKTITYQYIRELPDRIKDDVSTKDYDSVVTKSRTLLEEVMIFIIEQLSKERYHSNGDLQKMYAEAKNLLNMTQNKDWDSRVNDLLSGINKIIDSIGRMRNMNSDAHGVGSGRIEIKEREACLISASAVMVAEYMLSVYQKDNKTK